MVQNTHTMSWFTNDFNAFFKDLAKHNERDWFNGERKRYEASVKKPFMAFVTEVISRVGKIDPLVRITPREAIFRIHRDIRFSEDKSPYKTHAAIQFRHEAGKDAHAPGLYLHLEPGACGAAGGVWRPPMPALRAIRAKVAAEPSRWLDIVRGPALARMERFGERLQRVPAGFAADHPAAEELKYKDWGVWLPLSQKSITATDVKERLGAIYADMRPLLRFLCEALEQPF